MAMLFIGFSFFIYGMMMEYQFYVTLAVTLHLPQVPVPIGFYILMAASMFFIATPIVMLVRVKQSGSGKRFDATPRNQGLFDFIYRDGDIRDVYGDRIPGLGLFRIRRLGLIFDTGREPKPGSVYNIPGKKIRFALQDINFNPNPKFAGFYPYLTELGFNNMTEVNDVLTGYAPELMVKIWNKMCDTKLKTPSDIIVERIQGLNNKEIELNNKKWKNELRHGFFSRKQKKEKTNKTSGPVTPMGIIKKSLNERTRLTDEELMKIKDKYNEEKK